MLRPALLALPFVPLALFAETPAPAAMPELVPSAHLEKDPARCRFTYANPGRLPVLRAFVNGHEGLFLLDTGATVTVLTPDFAARAGLAERLRQEGAQINGKGDGVEFAKVEELRLGTAEFRDFHALLIDLSDLKNGLGEAPAGIIGANVLLSTAVTFDYATGLLTLGGELPADSLALPAKFSRNSPFILAQVDGKNLAMLVDTGASVSSLREGDTAAPMKKAGERTVVRAGESATEPVLKLDLGEFRAGPLTLPRPAFESSPTHRCLGTDFFAGGVLHLHAARGIIAIRRPSAAPAGAEKARR